MHRGDLHGALVSVLPSEIIHLGKKLVGLDPKRGGVASQVRRRHRRRSGRGDRRRRRALSGARNWWWVPTRRSTRGGSHTARCYPSSLLNGRDIGRSRTKWWGIDRHIVIYYTTASRSEIYFVTSVPEPSEWLTPESWSAKGDVKELRAAYEGFHEDVRAVLNACPDCHKWAILEREPLLRWSDGRVTLLGDACHPMTPYMAQGAATAIEDAAVLAQVPGGNRRRGY